MPHNLHFVASAAPDARAALATMLLKYRDAGPEDAEVIVALGGDGFMLQALHAFMNTGKPIYGMHCGSVGFLMNDFSDDALRERLAAGARELRENGRSWRRTVEGLGELLERVG